MTGPEHYKKAETFINLAGGPTIPDPQAKIFLAAAQAHATLALAAATALRPGSPLARDAWRQATGQIDA